MSPVPAPLPLADAMAAEDRLLASLRHREDRPRLALAAAAAIAAHALLLATPIPRVVRVFPRPPAPAEATSILRWLPSPSPSPGLPEPLADVEETEPLPAPGSTVGEERGTETTRSFPIPRWALEPVREPPPPVALRVLPPDAVTVLVPPQEDPGTVAMEPRPLEVVRPIVIPESRVEPEFPPAAVAVRARGMVIVEVSVRADGTVADVRAVESTRTGVGFEAAAVEAVRRWRFRPGRLGDEAVAATTLVRVEFR